MNVETLAKLAENKIASSGSKELQLRKKFLSRFKAHGLKETTQDSYKFTNLETFFSTLALHSEETSEVLPDSRSAFPTIELTNGELKNSDKLPAGVTVKKISEHFDQVQSYLTESNALSGLHHSLFEHGIFIEVDRKADVTTPLRILNLITKSDISSPTHLIKAHPQSRITIIEETKSQGISHANIAETYIEAMDGAIVEHIALQEENTDGLNHSSLFSEVAKDATVRSFIFHNSGRMNRSNLELNLNAAGANGESYALFLTNGKEHSDINTVINHKSADTTSNQIAKGILDAESKGVFTGLIHIFPKAQRVASGQLNKNLLLSKRAQVHSQPQLEIFADDVKCSHGSTTGQLSPEEIFYFQARGIPEEKARNLLAFGFGLEVVQKIVNPKAQEFISGIIKDSLATKFSLGRVL